MRTACRPEYNRRRMAAILASEDEAMRYMRSGEGQGRVTSLTTMAARWPGKTISRNGLLPIGCASARWTRAASSHSGQARPVVRTSMRVVVSSRSSVSAVCPYLWYLHEVAGQSDGFSSAITCRQFRSSRRSARHTCCLTTRRRHGTPWREKNRRRCPDHMLPAKPATRFRRSHSVRPENRFALFRWRVVRSRSCARPDRFPKPVRSNSPVVGPGLQDGAAWPERPLQDCGS